MADGYERASDGYDWAAVWPERATFDEAFKDVRRSCKQIGEQSLTDLVGDATLSFSIAMAYPGTVGDAFLWEWEWTPREPHPDAALKAR